MSLWVDRAFQAVTAITGIVGVRNLAPVASHVIAAHKMTDNIKLAIRSYLALDLVETAVNAIKPKPLSFPELLRKAMLAKRTSYEYDVTMHRAGLNILGAASLYSVPIPAFIATATTVLFSILHTSVMLAERRSNKHGEAFRALYIPAEYADIIDNVVEDEFLMMLTQKLKEGTLPKELLDISNGELNDDSLFFMAYRRQIQLAIESFICDRYNVQISLDPCEPTFFDADYAGDGDDDEGGRPFSPARGSFDAM